MVSPWDANDKRLRWWYTVTDAVAMEVNPSTGAIFTGPTRGSGYTEGTIWVMKASDMQGLTASQIQAKFAIPNLPTHYCYVNVPSGTQMYSGIVNPNAFGPGLGMQFEIGSTYQSSWFVGNYPLP